jgi:hypothetical protein
MIAASQVHQSNRDIGVFGISLDFKYFKSPKIERRSVLVASRGIAVQGTGRESDRIADSLLGHHEKLASLAKVAGSSRASSTTSWVAKAPVA